MRPDLTNPYNPSQPINTGQQWAACSLVCPFSFPMHAVQLNAMCLVLHRTAVRLRTRPNKQQLQ